MPKKNIKTVHEHPDVMEIVQGIIKEDGYISINWISYRNYINDKDAKALHKVEEEIGKPVNYGIVNSFGYETKDNKIVDFCCAQQKLTAIPTTIGSMVNLETLSLNNNQITSISPVLNKLVNLKNLNLSWNKISSFGEDINLPTLETLELAGNKIKILPKNITCFSKLRLLHINDNNFTHLPADMGRLTGLQSLYVSGNRLKQLPDSIGSCIKLETIYADNNMLNQSAI